LADVVMPTTVSSLGADVMYIDLRNQGFNSDSLITLVCFFSAEKRPAYQLNMRDSLYLVPVDAAGRTIVDAEGDPIATLPYTSIRNSIPYVIRSDEGAHVNVVNLQPGVDAFTAPLSHLKQFMDSVGYGFSIPWYGGLPALPTPGGSFIEAPSRRLLSFGERHLLQVNESSNSNSNSTIVDSVVVSNSTANSTVTNSTSDLGNGTVTVVLLLDSNATLTNYIPDHSVHTEDVALVAGVILGSMGVGVFGFGIFYAWKAAMEPTVAAAASSTAGKKKRRAASMSRVPEHSTRSSAPSSRTPSGKKKSSFVDIHLDADDGELSRLSSSHFHDRDAMMAL
jgi:hypothetical protein